MLRNFFRDLLYLRDIATVVMTPIILLPFLLVEGVGEVGKCAYCVCMMAIFWITEALPIAVTSLIPVFLFPIVGILSIKDTSHEYINETNMLFVGGVIVAAAIEHWNIHTRLALKILLKVGPDTKWLMLGLMVPTWFMSMWISNTATAAMMVPIANAILMQLKDTEDEYKNTFNNSAMELDDIAVKVQPEDDIANGESKTLSGEIQKTDNNLLDGLPENVLEDNTNESFTRLCKCLSLSIAYSANCGGIGSLTGTVPNLVMKGQLDMKLEEYGITQSPITFATWMAFGIPLSFTLVIIVWIWLQVMFLRCKNCCGSKNPERVARVKAAVQREYQKLGQVTFGQGAVLVHLIVLVILWVTRDMGGEYGWGKLFKEGFVKDGVPAVFIATLLFIFPSKVPEAFWTREPLKPILSWRAAVDKVPWGVVFLLGGGFAMAKASKESGLSAWVGEKLSVLDFLDPWVLNLVLCYIIAAMTEVTSNTATCTLMMPILANLAVHLKQSPIYLMYPTAIATSFAFMLPVATPPNAVIFSYGYVKVTDMVKAGFVLNIICVLVLIGFTETLGNRLFDFHTFPPEIALHYNITA
ncbi:solute carrier family 13 member 2-like [Mya arenaria]|uniref:solute carrier family 13 member 2-like n=1 Tax=Mya arenaria TaxID=6604 RepID=UPI0022E489BB|nr:solute carrier family 13 member 2-like [Mya arenaria]